MANKKASTATISFAERMGVIQRQFKSLDTKDPSVWPILPKVLLCLFIEVVFPHTLVSQASLVLFFCCTALLVLQQRRIRIYRGWPESGQDAISDPNEKTRLSFDLEDFAVYRNGAKFVRILDDIFFNNHNYRLQICMHMHAPCIATTLAVQDRNHSVKTDILSRAPKRY